MFHSDEGTWEVKSGMQHPSYGGRYKSPCFHSDEGTWEVELEGEAIHMEGGPLLWSGSQPSVDSPLHNMGGPVSSCRCCPLSLPPSLPAASLLGVVVAAPVGVVREGGQRSSVTYSRWCWLSP